ncbi:hypothetical protein GEMRC1_006012 [Eukaryota sp. GEM-RC1]
MSLSDLITSNKFSEALQLAISSLPDSASLVTFLSSFKESFTPLVEPLDNIQADKLMSALSTVFEGVGSGSISPSIAPKAFSLHRSLVEKFGIGCILRSVHAQEEEAS